MKNKNVLMELDHVLGYGTPQHIYWMKEFNRRGFSKIYAIEPYQQNRTSDWNENGVKIISLNKIIRKLSFNNYFVGRLLNKILHTPFVYVICLIFFVIHRREERLFYFVYPRLLHVLVSKTNRVRSRVKLVCNFIEVNRTPFENFLSSYINLNLLIAPNSARLIAAQYMYKSEKSAVVHNSVKSYKDVLCQLEYSERDLVLYTGRVSKMANGDRLIELIKSLPQEVDIVIAGPIDSIYESRFKDLSNKSNFKYLGVLKAKELITLRQKATFGIVSWSEDSFATKYCAPNKLYEYLSSGLKIICFSNLNLKNHLNELNAEFIYEDGEGFLIELKENLMKGKSKVNTEIVKNRVNFDSEVCSLDL